MRDKFQVYKGTFAGPWLLVFSTSCAEGLWDVGRSGQPWPPSTISNQPCLHHLICGV
jgi:hypothetical protein